MINNNYVDVDKRAQQVLTEVSNELASYKQDIQQQLTALERAKTRVARGY